MIPDMSVSVVKHQPVVHMLPMSTQPATISRPQVGIERLPARRMSNEPRESMNCKSCRKRKIKCNRLRPACEACQIFQCPCVYDAVPKKRGPKTDVLEALLKRVDGLEQRLKDQKQEDHGNETQTGGSKAKRRESGDGTSLAAEIAANTVSPTTGDAPTTANVDNSGNGATGDLHERQHSSPDVRSSAKSVNISEFCPSPQTSRDATPAVPIEVLLNTYFRHLHAKPFQILDESSFRQRLQLNQVPSYLLNAVCGLASRSTPHPNGYQAAVRMGEAYSRRARAEVEMDEPSVDGLQTLLLLTLSFNASGKGRKAYMLLTGAIGMALALELHRETDAHVRMMPAEREMRRRLFWTSYLLDRFMACGSRRPSLIGDRNILLRLPCWSPAPGSMPIEGDFFQSDSNLQYLRGGSGGITNQYMAAGGVKGDSHFPWHSLSNLSKIRHDLDVWAAGTQDVFSSVESLFSQPDSTALVLSKLVYHLIHCLIYRPFLPVDLAELAGTGQHQSWQIEATNMCFLHANAVAELVELGKQMPEVEWPGFVGYCICTAGTVHIHGAHYNKGPNAGEMSVFSSSAEFLSREMQLLNELRYAWAVVQHHRQTLQTIYNTHTELIKSLATNPMRYTSVFHLDDFFDRYSNITGPASLSSNFDSANLSLADIVVDYAPDRHVGHDLYMSKLSFANSGGNGNGSGSGGNSSSNAVVNRSNLKRKLADSIAVPTLTATDQRQQPCSTFPLLPKPMAPRLPSIDNLTDRPHGETQPQLQPAKAAAFSHPPHPQHQQSSEVPFSPEFHFSPYASLAGGPSAAGGAEDGSQGGGGQDAAAPRRAGGGLSEYDPMFGTLQDNPFSTPSLWPAEDDTGTSHTAGMPLQSPGDQSNDDSAGGTAASEEKDPFLSLLEQLAETEYARGPGNELDFFLTGGAPSTS